jgi:hypothetical protein
LREYLKIAVKNIQLPLSHPLFLRCHVSRCTKREEGNAKDFHFGNKAPAILVKGITQNIDTLMLNVRISEVVKPNSYQLREK